jgi:2-keto-4-pentenoate hydratase
MAPVWEDERVRRAMAAQLERRRALLAEGAEPLGWKVGFGSPQMLERFQIPAPVVGFLTSASLVEPDSAYSLAGWTKPVVEPEIAVHIGRDLAPGADRGETQAAIAALAPALELADVDRPFEDLEAILGENIFQRGVVLGPSDPAGAGGDASSITARVLKDGEEVDATDDPQAFAGDVVDVVRHVAGYLAVFGERLRAGEVVITGSVVPAVPVTPGERIELDLPPLGRVGVSFA